MTDIISICCSFSRPPSLPPKPKKRRLGRTPTDQQPKLFGGSLDEYVEVLEVNHCCQINLYCILFDQCSASYRYFCNFKL